jgi:exonuclease SbcC
MRPLRLRMKGFGAFRESTEVDFADIELVALVGATGSGKSTIIDAITFALYGAVARYDDNRAVAPVINQTSAEARVSLDFELSGHRFVATRVVRRTTSGGATTREARLERGDEVLAADARTMSTLVEGLLGLDVDQFNRTVVLPQGRFADFIHDSPANRQATLRQLLGLEIYRRMGTAARARAQRFRDQIEALQPDLRAGEEALSDERRDALTGRITVLAEARAIVATARATLDDTSASLAEVVAALTQVDGELALVGDVRVPGDIEQLDRDAATAAATRREAMEAMGAARAARRAAAVASANGPDLATVKLQLQLHADAMEAKAAHERLQQTLASASEAAQGAASAAEAVRASQADLDQHAADARLAEDAAREAVAAMPSLGQIDHWLQLHSRRIAADEEASALEKELANTSATLEANDASLRHATEAAERATRNLDTVRQRAGAAGFVALLHVGEACPLCMQEIHELPTHHIDDDLAAAEREASLATAHAQAASRDRDAARVEHLRADAQLTAARNALTSADRDLATVASAAELEAQRDLAVARAEAAQTASERTQQAVAATTRHRGDPEHVRALEAADVAEDARRRADADERAAAQHHANLTARLGGVAAVVDLHQQLSEAERLAGALDEADRVAAAAEAADVEAAGAERRANDLLRQAADALQAARDRVATMAPPSLADQTIAEGWSTLVAWSIERRGELQQRQATLNEERDELTRRRDDIAGGIGAVVANVLGDEATGQQRTPQQLADLLTRREAEAESELKSFDQRRTRHLELGERVGTLQQQAAVADTLGGLLRADGFEGWLMRAALEQLVESASVRLMELSGGQYSLELEERTRSFAVRDHANADELRGARTLSGGETFLASLSLALALAEATAELAPEGAPQIESIFLDEGFGTLDAATLDTVAAAIEELGATGRMVAIVTHIRELADRMPVRLEVTKAGGSSAVVRVEAA